MLESGDQVHRPQVRFIGGEHISQTLLAPAPRHCDMPIRRVGDIVLDQHAVLRPARFEQQIIALHLAAQVFQVQSLKNQQALLAGGFNNRVIATTSPHPVAVYTRAATENIVAFEAIQHIVAPPSRQYVSLIVANQHIVESATRCAVRINQVIPPAPPVDGIATSQVDHHRPGVALVAGNVGAAPAHANQGIVPLSADQGACRAAICVAFSSAQNIIARAAV